MVCDRIVISLIVSWTGGILSSRDLAGNELATLLAISHSYCSCRNNPTRIRHVISERALQPDYHHERQTPGNNVRRRPIWPGRQGYLAIQKVSCQYLTNYCTITAY